MYDYLWKLFAIWGVISFGYIVAKQGIAGVKAVVVGSWGIAKKDFDEVESRVTTLEKFVHDLMERTSTSKPSPEAAKPAA